MEICPIPVDQDGIDVEFAIKSVPDASLALVTPGQQAPLGMSLSLARRLKLLDWAHKNQSWIIEDDYLGELQLDGRAAPALFSLDTAGRVIHLGSFSKTISPKLRIGFAVVPFHMINHFAETTATLVPAPSPSLQLSIQEFMHEGHFLRHLRRTKRTYGAQRDELIECLKRFNLPTYTAGLSVLINLPPSLSDQKIAHEALAFNLAPVPLSLWYQDPKKAVSGLMLGVATSPILKINQSCAKLVEIIEQHKVL